MLYGGHLSVDEGPVEAMLDELLPSVCFVVAVDQWLMESFA